MNPKLILIFSSVFLAACSAPATVPIQPTPMAPTIVAPQALATPTAAVLSSSPAATPVAPTRALTAPTLRERITLREMPGIGHNPYSLITLDGKVYVVNATTDNVAVIQNERVVKFIPVGKQPTDIVVDSAQKRIYVANSSDKTISLIVNDGVTLTTRIGEEPDTLLFFENRLFVGLGSSGNILVLDPTTLKTQATIGIPKAYGVITLAGDAVHHRIYASLYDKIAVIDSINLRVVTAFETPGSYYALFANPTNDSIVAAIYESATRTHYLTTLDPVSGSTRARVRVGGDPRGTARSADGTRAYVANSYSNTVSVINLRDMTPVAEIVVDDRPFGLALDEAARRLYVSNADSDNVNVIDTEKNKIVATIPVGMNYPALVVNETTHRVYMASSTTDSILVVQGNQVVKEISAGRTPVDLSLDAQNQRLFVANSADHTMSIIDEVTFAIRTTQPITSDLTTVAVDNARGRIFAGEQILDANTLARLGTVIIKSYALVSNITPDWIRLNPNLNRLYAVADNGVPGSNGRRVAYSIDATTLQIRTTLPFNGNVSQFAIDPETNRVFVAGTHPLTGNHELAVVDANDHRVLAMGLVARPAGIVYNPQTHHLFLSQAPNYSCCGNPPLTQVDNTVLVLDTNSWGVVAQLSVPAPGKMARLGNLIYIANRDDGTLNIIEDVKMTPPPSPTPTRTLTPYPTATRTAVPGARVTPLPLCLFPMATLAAQRWNADLATRLGCPTEAEHPVGFATEVFERGAMFWREDEKHVYVLFNDAPRAWTVFDDTWTTAQAEDACPSMTVAKGMTKPKRGFGKVWCAQSGVRAKIGAATGPETGFAPLTQKFERGQIFAGAQINQLFVLFTNGAWE